MQNYVDIVVLLINISLVFALPADTGKSCCKVRLAECLGCLMNLTPLTLCKQTPDLAIDCGLYHGKSTLASTVLGYTDTTMAIGTEAMPDGYTTAADIDRIATTLNDEPTLATQPVLWTLEHGMTQYAATMTDDAGNVMCCMAMIPSCLACAEQMTPKEWCLKHSMEHPMCIDILKSSSDNDDVAEDGENAVCCYSLTPECLACAEGMNQDEWCRQHKGEPLWTLCSLDTPTQTKKACCRGLTPECLSCLENTTPEEWCSSHNSLIVDVICKHINYVPNTKIDNGETKYSMETPSHVPGASHGSEHRFCCMAMSRSCLACAENLTPDEWCEEHRDEPDLYKFCIETGAAELGFGLM